MEWTIVTVTAALIGLIGAVARPLHSLNSTIAKLTSAVEALQRNLEELTERNSRTHGRIFEDISRHEEAIADHETRIRIMEKH